MDNDSLQLIDQCIDMLAASWLADSESIVVYTESDVDGIESFYDVSLPLSYRYFLKKMGRRAGRFLAGTDVCYPVQFELRKWSALLLVESHASWELRHRYFVFAMHQGYQFLFFDGQARTDPPVWGILRAKQRLGR